MLTLEITYKLKFNLTNKQDSSQKFVFYNVGVRSEGVTSEVYQGCVCEFWGPRVMGARAKEVMGWVIGFI